MGMSYLSMMRDKSDSAMNGSKIGQVYNYSGILDGVKTTDSLSSHGWSAGDCCQILHSLIIIFVHKLD